MTDVERERAAKWLQVLAPKEEPRGLFALGAKWASWLRMLEELPRPERLH